MYAIIAWQLKTLGKMKVLFCLVFLLILLVRTIEIFHVQEGHPNLKILVSTEITFAATNK